MSTLVVRRNPAAEMLSSWFDRMLGDASPETEGGMTYTVQPRMDIAEEKDAYFITLDVPGLTKEDISVKAESGMIKIEGERKEEKKGKYHRSERAFGRFLRSFSVPDDVEAGQIEAKVAHGVLELRLPKSEKAKAVEIKVL
jgi:HSP20 family protein